MNRQTQKIKKQQNVKQKKSRCLVLLFDCYLILLLMLLFFVVVSEFLLCRKLIHNFLSIWSFHLVVWQSGFSVGFQFVCFFMIKTMMWGLYFFIIFFLLRKVKTRKIYTRLFVFLFASLLCVIIHVPELSLLFYSVYWFNVVHRKFLKNSFFPSPGGQITSLSRQNFSQNFLSSFSVVLSIFLTCGSMLCAFLCVCMCHFSC